MRIAATSVGGARLVLAVGFWLLASLAESNAQFFNISPLPRPPQEVPGQTPGPAQNIAPPNNNRPAQVPKGQSLQSLPPATAAPPPPAAAAPPVIAPSGHASLTLGARFGRDLPVITGGLHWRVYSGKIEQGALRRSRRTAARRRRSPCRQAPMWSMLGLARKRHPNGAAEVGRGAARDVRHLRRGLRIEGKVGDARIPPGQITFDIYRGSQFEPGDKRPIVQAAQTGDVVLVPEGTYHIISNYGDVNAMVRSDIRVQAGKLTDATVTHRAAVITLKLVNDTGGEARADTQWWVLTPGGDVIKESTGAFPRVILAEGEYRAIARNDNQSYERVFKVVTGVDTEVEVLARH